MEAFAICAPLECGTTLRIAFKRRADNHGDSPQFLRVVNMRVGELEELVDYAGAHLVGRIHKRPSTSLLQPCSSDDETYT